MMTLAPAQPGDLPMLLGLEEALMRQYEDPALVDLDQALAWCRRKLEAQLDFCRRILWDGALAGFYTLVDQGDQLELDSFYILPEHRSRGIGTQVLNRLLASAGKPVYLYVFTENRRAMALYGRLGFRETEVVSPTRRILQWDPT